MTGVVVLNASYEPLAVVPTRRAILYVLKERAEIIEGRRDAVPYRSARGIELPVPLVVRFKHMIKVPYMYRELAWTRHSLFLRDDFECARCGADCQHKGATVDHVIPRSRGGEYTWLNTVTCCLRRNSKKANRTPQEAHMPLRYVPCAVFQRERLLIGPVRISRPSD